MSGWRLDLQPVGGLNFVNEADMDGLVESDRDGLQ